MTTPTPGNNSNSLGGPQRRSQATKRRSANVKAINTDIVEEDSTNYWHHQKLVLISITNNILSDTLADYRCGIVAHQISGSTMAHLVHHTAQH